MRVTEATEAAGKAASKLMYGGSAMSGGSFGVYFGLTKDEWALVFGAVGTCIAVAGFALTWYYKHRHLQLALAKAQADPEA